MEREQIRIIDVPAEGVCDAETGICDIPAQNSAEKP